MILWASPGDYFRGLESNLVAEIFGVAAGILVTFAIVDRVVHARLRENQRPVRQHLVERMLHGITMIDYSFAVALGLSSLQESLSGNYVEVAARAGARLDELADPRAIYRAIENNDPKGLAQLFRFTLRDARLTTAASEHLAEYSRDDVALNMAIARLDEAVQHLEMVDSMEQHDLPEALKVDSLKICVAVRDRALRLRDELARVR